MPVILERDAWPLWLGEAEGDPTALLIGARQKSFCIGHCGVKPLE
jgi:hypothetical protein